ncbi:MULTISPECIES: SPOR domain-containing protein [unclassified Bradyrhizobium]|uniref:SPOR domain-containing protein n=1 Tax=unclassified Bradyrhizobium TaxID=2631580 RepID=UPI0028E8B8D5|nr:MULTISPECIES: SPOR domain-containing protein [unclassified Bradyrhizobium]
MADRYQDRPFPADGFGRGGGSAQPESDPLAELARLIGQNDPFAAQTTRNVPSGAPRAAAPRPSTPLPPVEPVAEPAPSAGPPSWIQRANRQEIPRNQQREAPATARDPFAELVREPQRPAAGYPAAGGYQDPNALSRDFPEQDFEAQEFATRQSAARPEAPQSYPRDDFADDLAKLNFGATDPHRGFGTDPGLHHEAAFDEPEPDPSRYDDALFGPAGHEAQDFHGEQEFHEDHYAYQDGYDEADEEEEPKRRGGGMTTVFAILALGVLGTGGAFGYKTYFSTTRSGEAPIIKADNSPTKIMASPADSTPKVPDRLIGDGGEKLVSREETPVDVNSRSVGPRVVFPQLNQNANPPPPSSVSTAGMPPAAGGNNGILPNSDPRPISTLRISGNSAGTTSADASGGDAAVAAAPPPATKPATKPTRNSPANANASVNNAPLSLNPQSAAPAPSSRVAAVAPTESAPAASRSGGGYLVSISSQVSEEDALSSYKVTQSKYSSVLGSYSPIIRRVDMPDKSVRYRAAVGPFATREEANQMCGTLKTAGGQCFAFSNH